MAQQGTIDDGREAQFQEMMQRFEQISSKYRGVRGELLAKVRDELMRLKPERKKEKVATAGMLPSCRACGRTMREAGDGSLVCQNGHVRALAG